MRAEKVIAEKYKVGQWVKVIYQDSRFVMSHMVKPASKAYKKGECVVVRFVKSVKSFGITVQLDWKTFGTIELCEITDKIYANMLGKTQDRGLFAARVIDTDKKGRLMLSCRESVVD
jgi:ribosomal protein S1